jgi:hypothetical protein
LFHPKLVRVVPERVMKWEVTMSFIRGRVDGADDMEKAFPGCQKCNKGMLLPLSDYGRDGAPIMYKAWVCNNPDCGFNIRIDNGEISVGRDISTSVK